MVKNRLLSPVAIIFMCLLLLAMTTMVYARETLRVAKIAEFSGEVKIMKAGGEKGFSAFKGMGLAQGDRIITGKKSTLTLEIDENKKVVKIAENSDLVIGELVASLDSEEESSSFSLWSGGIWADVKNKLDSGSRFEIKTPTAVMGVRGTRIYVSQVGSKTTYSVIAGSAYVSSTANIQEPDGSIRQVEVQLVLNQQQQIETDKVISDPDDVTIQEAPLQSLDLFVLEIIKELAATDPESFDPDFLKQLDELIEEKTEEKNRQEEREEEEDDENSEPKIEYDSTVQGGSSDSGGGGGNSPPPSQTFTVSFNVDDGSTVADQNVNYGGNASQPTDPTKTGHTFAGWYTDDTFATAFDFANTAITGNTTIYAKWTINQYTVSFNVDGGSTVADQNVNYGGYASQPTDPSKAGHTFAGWYTDDTFATEFDFETVITGNTTIYAKWIISQYTVSFNVDGGSTVADQNVDYGATASRPTDPTKTGHTFAGWYTDDTFATAFDFANTAITGNTTIYAKWTINQYTVSFNVDGGSTVSSQPVNYGGYASQPTDPSKAGHTFAGWYTDDTFATEFDFANTAITGNTTIYAKWTINQYTVSFNVDGGSTVSSQPVNYGGYASQPTDPTKAGHTFAGWYTDDTFATAFDFENTAITGNTTIYAKWTINQYTVSFNVDGGSTVADQDVNYNGVVIEPIDPTKAGYTFAGWYTDDTFVTVFDFANTNITADITIYAKWIISQCIVSFNVDGGSAVDSQNVNYGGYATRPIDPTKAGYTFAGWYTDDTFVTAFDFANTNITADITIYAKWIISQYTVSFDVDGGSTVSSQPVNYGGYATRPTDPTKAGYTFAGWYTDDTYTTAFDFANTNITADITIYAKWIISQYTVSFNVNGGSMVDSQTVNYGGNATRPTDPTKAGYTFAGWYTDDTFVTAFDFANTNITADITIYAKWTINQYTVSFDVDGGSTVDSQTVNYGGNATRPIDPTKAGYTFAGWYTDDTYTTAFDFENTVITGNTTIYAKWTIDLLPAVVLMPDTTQNNVNNQLEITTEDYNSDWIHKITSVKVTHSKLAGESELVKTVDYEAWMGINDTWLTLYPNNGHPYLQKAGILTVIVEATGYEVSQVIQEILPGVLDPNNCTVEEDSESPLAPGNTSTITVTARDQYGNPIQGHRFYLEILIEASDPNAEFMIDNEYYNGGYYDVIQLRNTTGIDGNVTFDIRIPLEEFLFVEEGFTIYVISDIDGDVIGSSISFMFIPEIT